MKASSKLTLSIAGLCIVVGSVAVVDMILKAMIGLLSFNFLVVLLPVGLGILGSTFPPLRAKVWTRGRIMVASLAVVAFVAMCLFPPFDKLTYVGARPEAPLAPPQAVTREFVGYHFYQWYPNDAEFRVVDYDFNMNLLEWQWLALASLATVTCILLPARPTAPAPASTAG